MVPLAWSPNLRSRLGYRPLRDTKQTVDINRYSSNYPEVNILNMTNWRCCLASNTHETCLSLTHFIFDFILQAQFSSHCIFFCFFRFLVCFNCKFIQSCAIAGLHVAFLSLQCRWHWNPVRYMPYTRNLVPRALFTGSKAREKRPGDEVVYTRALRSSRWLPSFGIRGRAWFDE